MASPAQIEANRRNALKSTGPKTPEGKDASRRNALVHGLCAQTLVLPGQEPEAVAARVAAWSPSLKPVGAYDEWLVEEVVLASLRIDRCRSHEDALRNRNARRAAMCWEADRRAEAEALGAKLAKAPSLTLHRLRSTRQGCDWLRTRWEGLLAAMECEGGWDAAQESLALDLLGTPKELRRGCRALEGDRGALAEKQIAGLREARRSALDDLDERERRATEAGVDVLQDRELRLARRYEAACARRMEWARKQIGKGQPAGSEAAPRPEVQRAAPEPIEQARPAPPESSPATAKACPTPPPIPAPSNHLGYKPFAASASTAPNRKDRRALKALARRA